MSTGLRIAGAIMGAAIFFPGQAAPIPASIISSSRSDIGQSDRVVREIYGLGPWRLALTRDDFSGAMRCTLSARDGRLSYQPGAVGFKLGGKDLLDAAIRVDGSPAVSFRDLLPELAEARARVSGRDMDRPTDGLVWVPAARLADARAVAIVARFGGGVRHYRVEGLLHLVAYARSQGCEPRGAQL